jgi:hypothetical protein
MRTLGFGLAVGVLAAACATTDHVQIQQQSPDNGQSTSDTAPSVTSAADFCGALCDREQKCDTSVDTQTCANACVDKQAAVFPRLRTDVVSYIVDCFGKEDCKTVLSGGVVDACAAEAVARVAPSDAAVSYCDALAAAKGKCGAPISKATCLDTAKLYTDDAIAQTANCTKRGCTEIDACVAAVFGFSPQSSTPTPPPTTANCATGFSDLGSCASCAASCCAEATACAADSPCRALLDACAGSASRTSCSTLYSSAPQRSQQLAAAYFQCASSKCTGTCASPG